MHKGKESEVAQSCPTLCDPMDYSLPGSSVHAIFQAIVLEWVAIKVNKWERERTVFLRGWELGWGRNTRIPVSCNFDVTYGCFICCLISAMLSNYIPSLRPPNVPPKPQKHRKSRPRSQYNAKLFNGDLETFIKVLAPAIWVADLHASYYNGLSLS